MVIKQKLSKRKDRKMPESFLRGAEEKASGSSVVFTLQNSIFG